jgi:hypothetical protein
VPCDCQVFGGNLNALKTGQGDPRSYSAFFTKKELFDCFFPALGQCLRSAPGNDRLASGRNGKGDLARPGSRTTALVHQGTSVSKHADPAFTGVEQRGHLPVELPLASCT